MRVPKELKPFMIYAAAHRWLLLLTLLLMLIDSAASLAIPWLTGRLAAPLLLGTPDPRWSLTAMINLLLGLCALQGACTFGILFLTSDTTERFLCDLRMHIYGHLQSLPLGFYHQRPRGEMLALLTRDAEIIGLFFNGALLNLIPTFLTFVGAVYLMLRIDFWLGLLTTSFIPCCFLLTKVIGRRIRQSAQHAGEAYATSVAMVEEHLRLLPVIKAFTREPEAKAQYHKQLVRLLNLTGRQIWLRSALGPLVQFVTMAGIGLLIWLAGQKVMVGALSPEALIRFLLYGLMLARPLHALATAYGQCQQTLGALARLTAVLQVPPESPRIGGREISSVRGNIEFCGISFAYAGRPAIFQDFHLTIAAGETVAFTGPNGAGKSTLIQLLMRFYTPQAGQIRLDGIDIATLSLASLRRHIGLVPQHVLLCNGTVLDNLAYGKHQPTQAEIESAVRAARAHDFIAQLPQGYDTPIGENGVKLSGGQQQRLALARALLKNPSLLILDEATAMYDPEGESELLQAIQGLLHQRTVLLITHHAAPLALADRIIRLEHGIAYEETLLPPGLHPGRPLR